MRNTLHRCRLVVLLIFLVAVAKGALCKQASSTVSFLLSRDAAAPAKTGAAVLSEALKNKGLQVKIGSERGSFTFSSASSWAASPSPRRQPLCI